MYTKHTSIYTSKYSHMYAIIIISIILIIIIITLERTCINRTMMYHVIYCSENRKSFSNFLNECKFVMDLISVGRELHSLGPAHSMLLRHSVVRAGGHTSRLVRLLPRRACCGRVLPSRTHSCCCWGLVYVYTDLNIVKRRKYLCTDKKCSRCKSAYIQYKSAAVWSYFPLIIKHIILLMTLFWATITSLIQEGQVHHLPHTEIQNRYNNYEGN